MSDANITHMESGDDYCFDDILLIQRIPSESVAHWRKGSVHSLRSHRKKLERNEVCLRYKGPVKVEKQNEMVDAEKGEDLIVFNIGEYDFNIPFKVRSKDQFQFCGYIGVTANIINTDLIDDANRIMEASKNSGIEKELSKRKTITIYTLQMLVEYIQDTVKGAIKDAFNGIEAKNLDQDARALEYDIRSRLRVYKDHWAETCNLRVRFRNVVIEDSGYQEKIRILLDVRNRMETQSEIKEIVTEYNRDQLNGIVNNNQTVFLEPLLPEIPSKKKYKTAIQDNENLLFFRDQCIDGDNVEQLSQLLIKYAMNGCDQALNLAAVCILKKDDKPSSESIEWLKRSSESGANDGKYNLALCMENGDVEGFSFDEAYSLFQNAAINGLAEAQFKVATYLEGGYISEEFPNEAYKWYLNAARQGLAEAQNAVGRCYLYGIGTDKDRETAMDWFMRGANNNNPESMYLLARCYEEAYSDDLEKDKYTYTLFRESAERGYTKAQIAIGSFYFDDRFQLRNTRKGLEWYKIAAEGNDPEAKYLISRYYLKNRGEQTIDKKYIKYLEEAAISNNLDAICFLGECYERGIGMEKNLRKAFEKYKDSAYQCHARSCYDLGRFYQMGYIVEKSDVEAQRWYRRAIQLGSVPAMSTLISYYRVDEEEQIRQTLNHMRYPETEYELGMSIIKQKQSGKEKYDAIDHIKRSADHGYPPSMVEYAKYLLGKNKKKYDEEAIEYLITAAEKNCEEAQTILGKCYAEGRGVESSKEKADQLIECSKSNKKIGTTMWACFEKEKRLVQEKDHYEFELTYSIW